MPTDRDPDRRQAGAREDAGAALPAGAGRVLLGLARQAIAEALAGASAPGFAPASAAPPAPSALDEPWLRAPGATFVTLTRDGRLRGCIGSVRARRPLADDVRANARAAAFGDPRFAPVTARELPALRVEVSLLSPATPLPAVATEDEALAALRPGIDGLILEYGGDAHATFLPQVWETLPAARDFLAHLKDKAGLPPGFWSPGIRLQRYTVAKWAED